MSELKRAGSTTSVMPGAGGATGTFIVIRISIPSQNLQKALRVNTEDSIWSVKSQIIEKMAKGIPDALNYGVYTPGKGDQEGKFLDEQRLVAEYQVENNETLEFRLKHKQGFQPNSKNYAKENNPKTQKKVMDSIRDGKLEDVKLKIGKIMDPNFVSEDGLTPLIQAVLNNDRDMISALVELGALIDYRTKWGSFSKNGAPTATTATNQFNSTWFTPMHVAASENKLVALQTLMYFGGSPDVKDSNSILPLGHACINGHSEVVRWILAWGAVNSRENHFALDLEYRDAQDRTYLHLACHNPNSQIIQMLCEHGADVSCPNVNGNTPLHSICAKPMANPSLKDCARILLSFGADRESKNKGGQTPAQLALMSGNMELSDFIKKWQSETVEEPTPLEDLIDSAKLQWGNIKKMMNIGNAGGKFGMTNGPLTVPSSGIKKSISGISIGEEERDTLGNSRNFVSGIPEASISTKSVPNEEDEDIEDPIGSSTSTSRHGTTKQHHSPTRPSVFGAFAVTSGSVQSIPGPPPGAPPASTIFSSPFSSSAPSLAQRPKMPPPPPPGHPPSVVMLFPGTQSTSSNNSNSTPVNTAEIIEKLLKIDEEKKKLEEELDRLKKLVQQQSQ